jgi:hypothetical protein
LWERQGRAEGRRGETGEGVQRGVHGDVGEERPERGVGVFGRREGVEVSTEWHSKRQQQVFRAGLRQGADAQTALSPLYHIRRSQHSKPGPTPLNR